MSDSDKIDYDLSLVRVTEALKSVESPGDCFTSGSVSEFPSPGLMIEGLGRLSLPLMDDDAKKLIDKCHLAPYGHRDQTIVDTQVRNTWELNTTQFWLINPLWPRFINEILEKIAAPMGISESVKFEAQLYKLLLYEAGGKFEKHRDSEKAKGMFGTLVVMLPCRFEGGELHVHHPSRAKNETHVWSPGLMNPYDLKYAAFYGDCEHEVKPVTSGYRLCLTYNLVTLSTAVVPRFAGNHEHYSKFESALDIFFRVNSKGTCCYYKALRRNTFGSCDKQLVYMLEHKYTEAGLSFAYLKNKDRLIAQCFAKYCKEKGVAINMYLCKVKYKKNIDVDDRSFSFTTFTIKSPCIKYGEDKLVHIGDREACFEDEIAPAGFFEKVEIDDTIDIGYTGNEGHQEEEWYKSAAIVLRPMTLELKEAALTDMNDAVAKWIECIESGSPRVDMLGLAVFEAKRKWKTSDGCFLKALDAICKLGDPDMLAMALCSLPRIDFQSDLAATVQQLGWEQCIEPLEQVSKIISYQSRVNLVCSVLDCVTDVSMIASLLARVDLQPKPSSKPTRKHYYNHYSDETLEGGIEDVSIEEYCRLLKINMLLASVDSVVSSIVLNNARS